MFAGYDYNENVLSITDAEVAADWRKGMIRATAQIIIEEGYPEGATPGSWDSYKGYREGSLGEHIAATRKVEPRYYERGHGSCVITSAANLTEDLNTFEEFNTFGGNTHAEVIFTADVTCNHGVSGSMVYSSSLGNIIGTLARTTS
jgi:hypothetical protein